MQTTSCTVIRDAVCVEEDKPPMIDAEKKK